MVQECPGLGLEKVAVEGKERLHGNGGPLAFAGVLLRIGEIKMSEHRIQVLPIDEGIEGPAPGKGRLE